MSTRDGVLTIDEQCEVKAVLTAVPTVPNPAPSNDAAKLPSQKDSSLLDSSIEADSSIEVLKVAQRSYSSFLSDGVWRYRGAVRAYNETPEPLLIFALSLYDSYPTISNRNPPIYMIYHRYI